MLCIISYSFNNNFLGVNLFISAVVKWFDGENGTSLSVTPIKIVFGKDDKKQKQTNKDTSIVVTKLNFNTPFAKYYRYVYTQKYVYTQISLYKEYFPPIHLIPKWRPINYSFVCKLISPQCLVSMYKTQKNFEEKMRQRGLINMQTKE